MANYYLQTLIPLLSIAFLIAAVNSESTSFAYYFYGDKPTTLTYQGDAHFASDSTFLHLIKTNASGTPLTNRIGRIVYSTPVQFKSRVAQANFGTTLQFIIKPAIGINPGDGLTFFIAPFGYGIPSGSTGGNFGIFDPSGTSPSVFAVEFDIINHHVGIDIESPASVKLTQVDDAIIGQEVTAKINYVEATKVITVNVDAGSQHFVASFTYDLGIILPDEVEVGISATTGAQVANFDVMSWSFISTLDGAASKNEGVYIRQMV